MIETDCGPFLFVLLRTHWASIVAIELVTRTRSVSGSVCLPDADGLVALVTAPFVKIAPLVATKKHSTTALDV